MSALPSSAAAQVTTVMNQIGFAVSQLTPEAAKATLTEKLPIAPSSMKRAYPRLAQLMGELPFIPFFSVRTHEGAVGYAAQVDADGTLIVGLETTSQASINPAVKALLVIGSLGALLWVVFGSKNKGVR